MRVVLRHWVVLAVAAILCAAAGGAFGYLRGSSQAGSQEETTQTEAQEQEWYDENLEMTGEYSPLAKEAMVKFRREWLRLGTVFRDHPLMKLDAGACEWENIVIQFENGSGNHKGLVSGWIQSADEKLVFGSESDKLARYKSDLLDIDDQEGETTVQAIAVDGWDIESAASYLKNWFAEQADKDGIQVDGIVVTHCSGHLKKIEEYRVNLSNMMTLMMGSITNVNSIAAAFPMPVPPTATGGSGISIKSVIKYVIAGFVLGLILGFCIVMFRLLRRGCIISRRQVESTFGLELLGDLSGGSSGSRNPDGSGRTGGSTGTSPVAVVNANLDLMIGGDGGVMLIGVGEKVDAVSVASALSSGSSHEVVVGVDLIDDATTIDRLQGVDGIMIGIRIGESRVADINRLMLRAGTLGKNVLGWVAV